MVFQRKSGGKRNKGKNKKPFEHDKEVDDHQLMKKTPKGKQSLGTPNGKQASFHIPGKNTPANKTPKFVAKTPNSGEKKQIAPGYKGTTMKEFQGMKAGLNKPKNRKVKDEDSIDDEEEDDEDFDLDLGGGDDENEGDDDTKNHVKDDDDDNVKDDDNEVEMLDKHKKVMKTNKEEKVKTPKCENVEATKPGKNTQVVKSEAESSPKEVPDQKVHQAIARQMESSRERNLRTLYIGNLPPDVEPEEIKALSSDILEVLMPRGNYRQWNKPIFVFVVFISEERAEANYKYLQEKELRGAKLTIDFGGEKGKNKRLVERNDLAEKLNLKKLFIQGFPSKTTVVKVAEIFPKSCHIALTKTNCAHVTFDTVDEAAAAFNAVKNATVKGTQLYVQYTFSRNKRKKHFKKPFQKKMKFLYGGRS